ncbi:MAG: GAF domain-containing protein [Anaerolineae bacterium]
MLDAVRQDTQRVAQYAARVFSDPEAFADRAYWRAQDRMFVGSNGQYKNAETDVSSAFVPDFVEVNEKILDTLELGAYLDFVFVPTYEGSANAVAIYLGTKYETTQYHPNIDLGALVPPDFQVTQRPWYVAAAPEENPERSAVWSPVYLDATGKGLLVTASSPVYDSGDDFVGVVGIDVTLGSIAASIEEARLLGGGYAFLLDGGGRAIALPEQGYRDILGRAPEADEVWADLTSTSTAFDPVLADMTAGSTGFDVLEAGGRELFVAYTPLESAGWSLGTVAEEEAVLQAMAPLQTELEASTRSMVLTRILPAGAGILIAVAAVGLLLARRLTNPIQEIAATAQRIGAGEWDAKLPETGDDEIGVLAHAFNQMTRQLRDLYSSLEERVAQRTADLERRAVELEAAAEVARDAATIHDMGQLLDETVHLISGKFGFYHAGIFLLDEVGRYAVLRAASSEGGRRMLERGHKLEVGRVGIVGYVAGSGEARIALDVGEDAVFFENPHLPNTRSEMALPLEVRGEIVGVLDVQSVEEGAFTDEDVGVLQTLADQVAMAIENARLLEESQRALDELEKLYGRRAREAWDEQAARRPTYRYTGLGVEAVSSLDVPDSEGSTGRSEWNVAQEPGKDGRRLAAPIRLRGQGIGSVILRRDPEAEPWSFEEATLVEEVSTQIALALENARLYQDAQRTLGEVRALNAITTTVSRSLQLDEVLQETLEQTMALTRCEVGLISLVDSATGQLYLAVDHGLPETWRRRLLEQGMEGTLCDYVYRRGALLSVPDFTEDAPVDVEGLLRMGLHSYLGIPLESKGETVGTICVFSYAPLSSEPALIPLLESVGRQVGVAVENAQLFEQARQRAERERLVADITAKVRASSDVETIMRTAVQELGRALNADRTRVQLAAGRVAQEEDES